MNSSARVKFDNPPVVEVACSILFSTEKPLRGVDIGIYGQSIQSDFPRNEEVPPLVPAVELQEPGTGGTELRYLVRPLPPLRRTWFISDDGRNLIQVQEDRFIFNWKKGADDDKYPSYDQVIERFDRNLAGFLEFLTSKGIGPLVHQQFELIYVNHIPIGGPVEVSESRLLVDHIRDTARPRFLGEPVGVNWVSIYELPNQEGRLYMTARSARAPDGHRILRLDMTARGIPVDVGEAGRRAWFDQAHTWITKGFADLTAEDVQQRVWKRTA